MSPPYNLPETVAEEQGNLLGIMEVATEVVLSSESPGEAEENYGEEKSPAHKVEEEDQDERYSQGTLMGTSDNDTIEELDDRLTSCLKQESPHPMTTQR